MISGLRSKSTEQKQGFLQFSQKLDYGLFLLIELARIQISKKHDEPVSLRTIAEENKMSFFFMQKVAFELRKSGIISADRGKNGGYVLAKPSSEVTLKDIVEVLEGPVTVMHCLASEIHSTCERQPRCTMRHGLSTVNQAIINIFSQTTLNHLLHPTWKQAV